MKKMIQHSYKLFPGFFLLFILLSGCGQDEIQHFVGGNTPDGSEPVAFSINLKETPEYGVSEGNVSPIANSNKLISEFVEVSSFNATRGSNDSDSPKVALMELSEDTVSKTSQTRGITYPGHYFRVILFEIPILYPDYGKFVSVADYVSNGTNTPELKRGSINLSKGKMYRFFVYSFNDVKEMDPPSRTYILDSDIFQSNLEKDFMFYDSGNQLISNDAFKLPVSFKQMLSKVTIKISATGFSDNTVSCTGVRVAATAPGVSHANAALNLKNKTFSNQEGYKNVVLFDIPNQVSPTVRIPAKSRTNWVLPVHFGVVNVDGKKMTNLTVNLPQNLILEGGKSYTMTIQFKKRLGINLSTIDINMDNPACTQYYKNELSKLIFAEGNLKGTSMTASGDYVWGDPTEYGHYYTWNSLYTGNNSFNGTQNPCGELDPKIYGSGWHVMTYQEALSLYNCSNKTFGLKNDIKGWWFMNNSMGLFLPAAGFNSVGSSTKKDTEYQHRYWTSNENTYNKTEAYSMYFSDDYISITTAWMYKYLGMPIRCVKSKI